MGITLTTAYLTTSGTALTDRGRLAHVGLVDKEEEYPFIRWIMV